VVSGATADVAHMTRALRIAERGRGRTSPNPMVGALIVDDDGAVVGRGYHKAAGGPHAEVHALEDAGPRARGATLYCTLEPCSHTGRTGPCAHRVVEAGIRRAVVAIGDPNPRVHGRGFEYLRGHGVEVSVGTMREEAERLNRPFFTLMQRQRPFITLKSAVSLDGCVAAHPGVRTQLTGAAAATVIHRERAEIDALAVGSATVLVDDPQLTARGIYRHRPLVRVIFDRRLRTPPTARVLSTLEAGPVIVFAAKSEDSAHSVRVHGLIEAGAQVELVDPASFLESAARRLGEFGITSMVVEGGPTLQQAFWNARLVDRIELFIAPKAVGAGGVPWIDLGPGGLASLRELTASPAGNDVLVEGFVEGYVHRTD
jgi:diaminohydroxyphosphoribosylaminopyrimidine deaminase / 5-amino-6-(5-phosphoribosylamino)uracil reductase